MNRCWQSPPSSSSWPSSCSASAVRVLREYERGVIFRLGRLLSGPKGPGLILLDPAASTGWSRPTCAR